MPFAVGRFICKEICAYFFIINFQSKCLAKASQLRIEINNACNFLASLLKLVVSTTISFFVSLHKSGVSTIISFFQNKHSVHCIYRLTIFKSNKIIMFQPSMQFLSVKISSESKAIDLHLKEVIKVSLELDIESLSDLHP